MAPGTYRGTVTVTSASGTESRAIDVTLTITGAAAPVLRSVVHGATLLGTRISPGLILSILGSGLGPVNGLIAGVSSAGAIDSTLGGVRVFFDGVAAPLLFVRQDQINAIAPYALYGRVATRVQVEVNGVRSETLELSVVDTAPGLFTIDGTGRGQLAALNEDGRVNGPANPAAAGSIIVLYATGEGQTAPPGQDGRIIANDLRRPLQAVSVTIGGVPVEVLYAGSAPGLVSGALQINVRLSQAVPRGNTIPVEMSVGLGFAQGAISVAIQ